MSTNFVNSDISELKHQIELSKIALSSKKEQKDRSKLVHQILNQCIKQFEKSIAEAKVAISENKIPHTIAVQLPDGLTVGFGRESYDPEVFVKNLRSEKRVVKSIADLFEFKESTEGRRNLLLQKITEQNSKIEGIKKEIVEISDTIKDLELKIEELESAPKTDPGLPDDSTNSLPKNDNNESKVKSLNLKESTIKEAILTDKKKKNKGITKEIRDLIPLLIKKEDKNIKLEKDKVDEFCVILKAKGFDPDHDSVHSMLNQEEIGNTRT